MERKKKVAVLFCTPLDGPVPEDNGVHVKIRLPDGCDATAAISDLLDRMTGQNLSLTVIDKDVRRYESENWNDGMTIVMAMYDKKRDHVRNSVKHVDVARSAVTASAIDFTVRILKRPDHSEEHVLKMRIYIGQHIVGECLPMPLYFYPESECRRVDDATIKHFSVYDKHLRMYFDPTWTLSWEPFIYSKLLFSVYLDPDARYRSGARVAFVYHVPSRTIVSRLVTSKTKSG